MDFLGSYGSDDDKYFVRQALPVEPPTRRITEDTVPQDGFEFIHKSRLEELSSVPPYLLSSVQKKMYWKRVVAQFFEKRAKKLQANRAMLIRKFPLEIDLPGKDEKKWCKLCLGSKLYNEIYKNEPCSEKVVAYFPVLSIVSHLQQDMVKSVLKYLYRWFLAINMNESIACWVYSLFACLERPVGERCQKFIEAFKVAIRKRMKACDDESEGKQLHLILAILDENFSIN
ncbi:uncharacterized protein TNCT_320151 [Trichonephila clavata]|uniref:Gem-associated protein 2 n=1 Tax=Trichonephila clavata TaxID=2740835 RepID=A0A8X6KQ84_TRICU|nr:uncharacterized protein TNCT_320151 [Trichonephila clavata]